MNRWQLIGSNDHFKLTKTNFQTQESQNFEADGKMREIAALRFIMDNAEFGDIIYLPNGNVLSVANRPALA